jgi:DNA-binding SARP family transcriptional activator
MSDLQVFLFGKLCVRCGQQTLVGLDAHRVRKLFCYLLLHRDRPHPREALASLLWDGDRTDQPNRCLRKTLWQLRATLDSHIEPLSDHVLLVEPDWVQLNPEADLWLDVAVFEQAFERVQGVLGRELDPQDVQILQSAVDLYRGGLQESWYQDWYLYERERFQHIYLIMLDKLMGFCEADGNYETGLVYGTLILRCERARERTHRRLMRLHCLTGDRTAALRQYERCVRALDEELGVKPAERTAMLYQQIRTDRLRAPTPIPTQAGETSGLATSLLPKMLRHLKKLQATLVEVQHQVKQDIQAVELAISDHR